MLQRTGQKDNAIISKSCQDFIYKYCKGGQLQGRIQPLWLLLNTCMPDSGKRETTERGEKKKI